MGGGLGFGHQSRLASLDPLAHGLGDNLPARVKNEVASSAEFGTIFGFIRSRKQSSKVRSSTEESSFPQ